MLLASHHASVLDLRLWRLHKGFVASNVQIRLGFFCPEFAPCTRPNRWAQIEAVVSNLVRALYPVGFRRMTCVGEDDVCRHRTSHTTLPPVPKVSHESYALDGSVSAYKRRDMRSGGCHCHCNLKCLLRGWACMLYEWSFTVSQCADRRQRQVRMREACCLTLVKVIPQHGWACAS